MKKVIIFIILFSIRLYSQIMTPEKVVSMISNRFSGIKGFAADFAERNGEKVSYGSVITKNPNLFRIRYSSGGNGQSIYCNGKTLWILFPRNNVVSEQKLNYGDSGAIYTAQGILRLTAKFNIDFYNERGLVPVNNFLDSELGIAKYNSSYAANDNRMAYHMLLTSKQASVDRTGFTKIHLWVDDTGMIIRILGITANNIPVEYWFTSIRYNPSYRENNKDFEPDISEDMQVLKDGLAPN
ncbi:outer membrane lipoprotein carrier protein LolA [uncultured Brachyspira sp.]|uniref:LolA family protein n=1 Tax=uncultured Brachyspira sp. TaxID=221953 RepID=UPI0025D3D0E5|nr:outer membrane lipoprotein carrier protein LolA [uncultured Brachyspira sp.]